MEETDRFESCEDSRVPKSSERVIKYVETKGFLPTYLIFLCCKNNFQIFEDVYKGGEDGRAKLI